MALAERGYDQLATLGGPVTVALLFVQAWADGDLVLGSTLVEVKVTKNPLPLRDAWLDQLLGYTLLDRATGTAWSRSPCSSADRRGWWPGRSPSCCRHSRATRR
jgi:hypothetical protein